MCTSDRQLMEKLQKLVEVDIEQLLGTADLDGMRMLEDAHSTAFKAIDRIIYGPCDRQTAISSYVSAEATCGVETQEQADYVALSRAIAAF